MHVEYILALTGASLTWRPAAATARGLVAVTGLWTGAAASPGLP
jgi:hypothetical protein